jgi:hypothetical protein
MELIPSFEGRHYKKPREPEEPRAENREKERECPTGSLWCVV